jgi:hypothetical protein
VKNSSAERKTVTINQSTNPPCFTQQMANSLKQASVSMDTLMTFIYTCTYIFLLQNFLTHFKQ